MVRVLAYVSFDVVPAPKGAGTHIAAFSKALALAFGRVDLVTVGSGSEATPAFERWPGVYHTALPALGPSVIDRVLCFRRYLRRWMESRQFAAIHFRSIFEGLELLRRRGSATLIYEVNGLPSVELKYRYPGAEDDAELMRKLTTQERLCLEQADLVITPSEVTQRFLNASATKIKVIPNGVDTQLFRPVRKDRTDPVSLLYFGTLTSWQGVDLAVRALAQIRETLPAKLLVVGSGNAKQRDALIRLGAKLGVAAHFTILPPVSQAELATYLHDSDIVLAPLPWNDRNVIQGCCPLKILEAMSAGLPVITTDLPVTRELGLDEHHFLLVKPGSVDRIAEAALRLAHDPALAMRLGKAARERIEQQYTWELAGASLIAAYEELGIKRSSTV